MSDELTPPPYRIGEWQHTAARHPQKDGGHVLGFYDEDGFAIVSFHFAKRWTLDEGTRCDAVWYDERGEKTDEPDWWAEIISTNT